MDRDFTAEHPGEKLVSDLTYIATDEGFLFLVCVIDVCTRRVVGWSMSHEITTSVFLSALLMAVRRFDPSTCLLHHSDRGSQYCSKSFQEELSRLKIQCSMSRKRQLGQRSFRKFLCEPEEKKSWSIKHDTRHGKKLVRAFFSGSKFSTNRMRLHSTLGYVSPEQFEQQS